MPRPEENVLVVHKDLVPPPRNGVLIPDDGSLLKTIREHGTFVRHDQLAGKGTDWREVIPYGVFSYHPRRPGLMPRYFAMERLPTPGEARLAGKVSLGIGGHVTQGDMSGENIKEWASREFEEEVNYGGGYKIDPLGLIHDNTTPIDSEHIAYAMLLTGDSSDITVRDEHKRGSLKTLAEIARMDRRLETWSRVVHGYLASQPASR